MYFLLFSPIELAQTCLLSYEMRRTRLRPILLFEMLILAV